MLNVAEKAGNLLIFEKITLVQSSQLFLEDSDRRIHIEVNYQIVVRDSLL